MAHGASLALFGVCGLLFGSFANVVIWRVPRGQSVAFPGSHCPSCGHDVRWYDNIPVLSWLVLHGKCRDCAAPITVRYVIVEAASGVLFALAAFQWGGLTLRALFGAIFFWLLLVLSLIDLEHRRLPNVLVAILAGLGLAGSALAQVLGTSIVPLTPLAASGILGSPLGNSVIGALIGIGISGGSAAVYALIRRARGLGMGDVKFLGALGLFLGPYVLMSLFFGSLFGTMVGLIAARTTGLAKTRIPFGPWLAAGSLVAALAGPAILAWYLGLAGMG